MFYRKAIENTKKIMAKLKRENSQWKSLFLIELLSAFKIFSYWMFFSFVSFITNLGFFLTRSENMAYADAYDDMITSKGYFSKIKFSGLRAEKNQDLDIHVSTNQRQNKTTEHLTSIKTIVIQMPIKSIKTKSNSKQRAYRKHRKTMH